MDASEQPVRIMIGDTELTLHPLDSADIALTPAGADLVRRAALAVLGGHGTAVEAERLSLRQLVDLFTDLVCWEESSGRLFMCADLPGHCYCLPIPAEHWRVMTRGQSTH